MAEKQTIQTTRVFSEIQRAYESGYTLISEQGSSRSSKTYNTLIWLIYYLLQHPCVKLSIVRKTLPSLKGSVLDDFEEIMRDKFRIWNDKAFNKSELVYKFPNGSKVEFFSTDNETKLRGRKRHILYVNEANELTFLEWQQLKMRTTILSVIDYNPSYSDEHWINSVNADPRTYHFITTYKDNPFLEQNVIDEIESLKDRNEGLWRIYGLGLQSLVEGLIFPHIEIVDSIPARVRNRFGGLDWGFHPDPAALIEVGIDGNSLYVDEICYRTEMLVPDYVDVLKKHENLLWIADSSDPRLRTEIARAGVAITPVTKFKDSIQTGLLRMQQMKIHVTARSVNTIKEFRSYVWARTKDGAWTSVPEKNYGDHAIDAIRYVVMEKILGGERRKIDIGRLADMAY